MRKRYIVLLVLSWVLMGGAYFVDRYLLHVPTVIAYVLSGLAAVMTVLFILKSGARKMRIVLPIISALAILIFIMPGVIMNPYWNSVNYLVNGYDKAQPYDHMLSSEEAVEDLEVAVKHLKKAHPLLKDGFPQEMQDRYDKVSSELKNTSEISVSDLNKKIEYIFTYLNDGHTYTLPLYDFHFLKAYYDGAFAKKDIVAVNGVPMDEILTRAKDLYSYEMESWELVMVRDQLVTLEGLVYMGFDTEKVTYTVEADGEEKDLTYTAADFVTSDKLEIKSSGEENEFVRYSIDEEHSLALMVLDKCIDDETYEDTLKSMFTEVRDKGIKNVAVDIRNNGGGSDAVVGAFFRYLDIDSYNMMGVTMRRGPFVFEFANSDPVKNDRIDELTFKGDVYLLTSPSSFSSAMIFAQYVKDNHLGTLVGEAPGNDANGNGDIVCYTLPNSGILVSVSTKHWLRADRNNPSGVVEPDIECDSTFALDRLYEILEEKK